MTINVKININSPTGKKLEKELRQYPEVVEFVDINIVSDIHHKGYPVPIDTFDQLSTPILINTEFVILSRRFSFFKPLYCLYSLAVLSAHVL